MSTNFDWDQFEDADASSAPRLPQQQAFDWDQFEDAQMAAPTSTQQSMGTVAKEALKGLGRISGRGAASLLAAPSKGIGGALELLSKIYPEDEGLRGMHRKGLESAGKFLQETGKGGEEHLKGLIEKALGKSYGSGEEALAEFTERAADIYGRGPFKGMGVPSVIGGAAGQTAKELGAPEEVQQAAELIGIAGPDIKKATSALRAAEKIKEKSGLIAPRIMHKTDKGWKFLKGKVFPGSKEKAYEKVSKQAEELIKAQKASALPLSKEIEKGINVESKLNNDLSKLNKLASKMDHRIESNLISDYLNKAEENIRKTPVPTKEGEEILGLISKFRDKYGEIGGKRFYTPDEYVKQYRNINQDAKTLYERAYIEGKKKDVREFYRGLNDEIGKTLESGTPESFSNLFKETNAQYHELQKLNAFEGIMENVITNGVIDAKKFGNIFKSPSKSKLLRKQVGPKSFEQMRLISNDLEKVKDKLGLLDEFGAARMIKSVAVGGLLKGLKLGKIGIPLQAGKKASDIAYGYFLLNPQGQRDFRNFLKALESGSKKATERYLKTMDKHALEEEQKMLNQ